MNNIKFSQLDTEKRHKNYKFSNKYGHLRKFLLKYKQRILLFTRLLYRHLTSGRQDANKSAIISNIKQDLYYDR